MIDGPHIFGSSPVALCINLTSALASARLVSSVRASINAGTLSLVGLVLLSAIAPAFRVFQGTLHRGTHATAGWPFMESGAAFSRGPDGVRQSHAGPGGTSFQSLHGLPDRKSVVE